MSSAEKCPYESCHVSDTLKRVLCHIRDAHDPNLLPGDFIARLNLLQCSFCKRWYLKLKQHTSQCRSRKSVSDGQRSSQGHTTLGASSPPGRNVRKTLSELPPSLTVPDSFSGDSACHNPPQRVSLQDAHADLETAAWNFIRDLPSDAILKAIPPRVVQTIKPAARALFHDCCAVALRKIHDNPGDELAWKLLFLIPRMILTPMVRGGRHGFRDVKVRYQKFLSWNWSDLLQLNGSTSKKTPRCSDEARRAATLRLVRCGELSRASRLLTSKGLAPASEDTTAKLASKHPSRATGLHLPSLSQDSIKLSSSALFDAIRRAPRGSGAGLSGWRFEHLKVLLENELTADCLFSACSAIARGILPAAAVTLFSSSRLIALPKSNGDIRPIAVGEAIRRLTARAICQQKKELFSSFFCPIQHGVATECGTELIVHHIELLLQHNPDWVVLKSDVRNAFNSISRQQMLEQVVGSFPDILNHVAQMYGRISPLVFMQGITPVTIESAEGVHQGDPLGPVLFATAIHSVLKDLQEMHPKVRILAYLDDVFVLGHPTDIQSAFQDLKKSFFAINMIIADSKCEIYCPSTRDPVEGFDCIPVTDDGAIFLGAPVGTPSFVASSCSNIAKSKFLLCNELVQLGDIQSAMLLLRGSHVPCLNHLARLVRPELLTQAASIHDSQTRKTFCHLLGFNEIEDMPWRQAVLPIRLGGFGMTSLAFVSQPAFVASWAHAIVELPLRFPSLFPAVDSLVNSTTGALSNALTQSVPDGKHISEYLTSAGKVQHQLSMSFARCEAEILFTDAPTARDAARHRSTKGKGAGAWLNAIPTSEVLALNSYEYRLASLLRLGLPIPLSDWMTTCNCGASLDSSGYHLLTCKTGGGPVWSHESLASVWSDCLRELHIHHRREPRHRYANSNDRPDIVAFDSDSGCNVDLDIALAHPWSSDIFPRSSETDDAAAERREERKKSKYEKECLPGGTAVSLIPLVMEHFGRWGVMGRNFLQKLAKKSCDEIGRPNAAEFLDFWRKRFSLQLQKCNAKVILRKMASLSSDTSSAKYSTQFFSH